MVWLCNEYVWFAFVLEMLLKCSYWETDEFVEFSTGTGGVRESWSAYMRYISRSLLKFAKRYAYANIIGKMIYILWYILVSGHVSRCIYICVSCDIAEAPPCKGDSAKIFQKFWELEIFGVLGKFLITSKVILKASVKIKALG